MPNHLQTILRTAPPKTTMIDAQITKFAKINKKYHWKIHITDMRLMVRAVLMVKYANVICKNKSLLKIRLNLYACM